MLDLVVNLNVEQQEKAIAEMRTQWNCEFEKNYPSFAEELSKEIITKVVELYNNSRNAYSVKPIEKNPINRKFTLEFGYPSDLNSFNNPTLEPFKTWQGAEKTEEIVCKLSSIHSKVKIGRTAEFDRNYFLEKTNPLIEKIKMLVSNKFAEIVQEPQNKTLKVRVEDANNHWFSSGSMRGISVSVWLTA